MLDGIGVLFQFVWGFIRQVAAQTENHSEWCAKLMGDVCKETLAHFCKAFQGQVVATVYALYEVEHHQCTNQYYHNDYEDDGVGESCRPLVLQVCIDLVHRPSLNVAFYEQSCVLYAVQFLHIDDAVFHGCCLLVRRQRRAVVALAFV